MIGEADSLKAFVDELTVAHRDLVTAKTKAQFDEAFALIVVDAVRRIEKDCKHFAILGEDPLSSIFVGFVNWPNILEATREEYSNGHVDITFRARRCNPPREALGEAKVFNYYDWHEKGLTQLMQRYSTGREERGLLLVYVKKPHIKTHFEDLKSELDKQLPCSQLSKCTDHPSVKWSFVTRHKHPTDEELEVWHLGCNLYHPESEITDEDQTETTKGTPI